MEKNESKFPQHKKNSFLLKGVDALQRKSPLAHKSGDESFTDFENVILSFSAKRDSSYLAQGIEQDAHWNTKTMFPISMPLGILL